MTDLFDSAYDNVRNGVEAIGADFKKPDDDWMQVAQLYSASNKQVHMVPLQFDNDHDKDTVSHVIASAVHALDVDVVAFVLSAWRVTLGPNVSREDIANMTRPSQHNDREEVVLVSVVSADRQRTDMAPIIRHENAPPTLGEWETQGQNMESRIIDPVLQQLVMRKNAKKGGKNDA